MSYEEPACLSRRQGATPQRAIGVGRLQSESVREDGMNDLGSGAARDGGNVGRLSFSVPARFSPGKAVAALRRGGTACALYLSGTGDEPAQLQRPLTAAMAECGGRCGLLLSRPARPSGGRSRWSVPLAGGRRSVRLEAWEPLSADQTTWARENSRTTNTGGKRRCQRGEDDES